MRVWPCLVLASCHATTTLEAPDVSSDAETLLLAIRGEGLELLWVADASAPALDLPTFTRPEEIDVYASTFSCPPATLNLEPGAQMLRDEPASRFQLPSPLTEEVLHDGGEDTGWSATTDRGAFDALLRRLTFDRPANLCALYAPLLSDQPPQPFAVGTSTPTVIAPLADGRALVGNADGTWFAVAADQSSQRLTHISTSTPNRAAVLDANGVTYVFGRRGEIARSEDPLTADFTLIASGGATASSRLRVATNASGTEFLRTSASTDPDGFSLMQRGLERYRDGTWTQLTEGGADRIHGTFDVAYADDGVAWATGVLPVRTPVRIEGEAVIEEKLPNDAAAHALVNVPRYGIVAGASRGGLFRRSDGRWVDEEPAGVGSIRNIVPTDHGYVYGAGGFGAFDDVAGHCFIGEWTGNSAAEMIRIGERDFLAYDVGIDSGALIIFNRVDDDPECLPR